MKTTRTPQDVKPLHDIRQFESYRLWRRLRQSIKPPFVTPTPKHYYVEKLLSEGKVRVETNNARELKP